MRHVKRKNISAALFAALIVILYTAGWIADNTIIVRSDNVDLPQTAVIMGLSAAAAGAAVYFCTLKLFAYIDLQSSAAPEQTIRHAFWKFTAFFMICWLPYMLIRFPGNMDPDTYWEILEPYGLAPANDHHPWFDTIMFYFFWRIGDLFSAHSVSLFLYGLLQMLFTAMTFSFFLCYLTNHGIARKVRTFALIFWAFYPCVPMFAQTMAKDMMNGWLFVLFIIGYMEILQLGGEVMENVRFDTAFLLTGIFMALTKKTGIYILLLSMILLLIICRRYRGRILGAVLLIFALYQELWTGILLPYWNVADGEQAEMLSIPSQQVAELIAMNSGELTAGDWKVLNAVYDSPEKMSQEYNPVRADNTKAHWKNDASETDKRTFFVWYLEMGLKHPLLFINVFNANNYPLLCMDTSSGGDESLIFYRNNVPVTGMGAEQEKTYASWSGGLADQSEVHAVFASAYRSPWAAFVSRAFDFMLKILMRMLPVIFSKVLFAVWVPMLIMFYAFYKKSVRMFAALLPVFLNTLTLAAGPVVLPRYMVNSVYVFPVLIALPFIMSSMYGFRMGEHVMVQERTE